MAALMKCLAAILLATAAVVPAPGSAATDPPWLELLGEHARLIEQCDIDYIVRFQESELAGRRFYEARIKCADGRMFDATRTGPAGFFEFKACEVKVC
jgi:hypothetical protein